MSTDVTLKVTPEMLWNSAIGLCEGGYSDWVATFEITKGEQLDYGEKDAWNKETNPSLQIHVIHDDPEDPEGSFKGLKNLTWTDIEKGLQLMAEHNQYQFTQLIEQNDDAITHDVVWQFIILGEEVYG